MTDNLGDWAVIRKRLNDELERKQNAPLPADAASAFQPFTRGQPCRSRRLLRQRTGRQSPAGGKRRLVARKRPARCMANEGKHTWSLTSNLSPDGIMVARHAAPSDDGKIHRAGADAGAARAGPVHLGSAARRRGLFRAAPAARAFHRRACAALGALQTILRRRTGSDLLHARILEEGHGDLFRRRRFRGLWRLGCADWPGARSAAAVPPLHGRELEGLSRGRRQDHFHGHRAGAGDIPSAGRGL